MTSDGRAGLTESNVAIAVPPSSLISGGHPRTPGCLKHLFQGYGYCNVYAMMVSAQIDAHLRRLTPAERRVAAVVADDPEAVAFGTVADVARRAGTSGASVVRLAAKLGFEGFVELA